MDHSGLFDALYAVWPGLVGSTEARSRLASLLDVLQATGALALPRGRRSWDHSQQPALPSWVRLPAADAPRPTVDHRSVPWAPELAFVASLPRVHNLDELLAIQRFFAAGGRDRPVVPVRERSLELFGDEKRLDALSVQALFGPGRLTLTQLRCVAVAPPLAWQPTAGPPGRPLLIIENLHSWHSFCRFNAATGAYAGVVYGGGAAIQQSVAWLEQARVQARAASGPLYFGDLDPDGLAIAATASARAVELGQSPIQPATLWYQALLDHPRARSAPNTARARDPEPGLAWLGDPLRARVHRMFARGERLAQEWVGLEALMERVVGQMDGKADL